MATLLEVRTDVRAHLDEQNARFWLDSQLDRWINEACRDIARRAETIQERTTTIPVVAGASEITLPDDVLRVHRVEFVPTGQTQVYPLGLTTYEELDQLWGINPSSSMSYPSYAAFWGYPPNVKLRFYPVPAQTGTLNLYYYRLPTVASGDTATVDVLAGWEDLIVLYCEYMARRKDRDPQWQDAKALYEERLDNMYSTTRQWHDQAQVISVGSHGVPSWLYSFEGGY